MFTLKLKKDPVFPWWLLRIVIIFFIVSGLAAAAYLALELSYQNKIYPGISVAGIKMGGLTKAQAMGLLNKKIDHLNQHGIQFGLGSNRVTITPLVASMEGDIAYQLINFDAEKTAAWAVSYGRENKLLVNLGLKFNALVNRRQIPLLYTFNSVEIKKILEDNFSQYAVPAEDASLVYTAISFKPYFRFSIREERIGQAIDYDQGIKKLEKQLATVDTAPIILSKADSYPTIYKKDSLNIEAKAKSYLDAAPLTLFVGNEIWPVKRDDLVGWLTLRLNPENTEGNKIAVGLNKEVVKNYLNEKVAVDVNQPPVDAKFEIKDGKVREFQVSRDGIELNNEDSALKIENELLISSTSRIELVTRQLKSTIHTESINGLGIKQVIGIGESNYAGSPKNRRHNINVGADTLNGILIKPDEEFSLIKTLGEIDAAAGYLPELVIKDNKTTPEYGGGLCQIGTTMFRAALGTGLPITMRRNHSYRVSYYEPAGTDATIYDPWPDLRFINDTGSHILIQSRIEGDNLFFDFWGTPDGRIATRTYPVIFNIVKPAPTKIVETLDLKPGEKKCTEKAHNGADTSFDYTVTYTGGEVKEKRFTSHYVPWREVCLLGVEKLSSPEGQTATTTPAAAP